MPVYVLRNGKMVDKETGKAMNVGPWEPTVPMILQDIEPYQSPVTGDYIGGRRAKRYDLEANNCVDANDVGKSMGGKFKNKRFAAKRGLKVAEEYQ